jgi:hypothetical protein
MTLENAPVFPSSIRAQLTFRMRRAAPVSGAELHRYRAAGATILSESPLELLKPWLVGRSGEETAPPSAHVPAACRQKLLHREDVWLGDRLREVRCWWCGDSFLMETDDLQELVLADHGRLLVYGGRSDVCRSLLEEMIVGPALILSLAHHGTFALHAGAVVRNGAAHVFAGDSGAGKSTLADFLGGQKAAGCRRISDDILPLRLDSGGPMALPHYPQLKLAPDEQISSPRLERLPVAAVYVLDSQEGDGGERGCRLLDLHPRAAALALVRHTVAARFFTAPLLAMHLDFCTSMAESVPFHRLSYPRRRDFLPAVAEVLGMAP